MPCHGPASGILSLPRACCCCSPSTQAKETLMKEASAPPIIEEEKACEKRCLRKSRVLGPPQAMKKRTFQRAAGEEIFATVLCEQALSTKGMVTPWPSQKSLKARSRRAIIGM